MNRWTGAAKYSLKINNLQRVLIGVLIMMNISYKLIG